jgi:hypothetical protein
MLASLFRIKFSTSIHTGSQDSAETPVITEKTGLFYCNNKTVEQLYAYNEGYRTSYNGIIQLGEDEVAMQFIDTAEGLFLVVILDRPEVQGAKESLHVNATSMLPGTAFANIVAGLIKDGEHEIIVDGQSVGGNFVWSSCCTDGFAASGFQDAAGNFDVEITFKHNTSRKEQSLVKRIFLESYDKGRTELTGGVDLDFDGGDIFTVRVRGTNTV